MAWRGGKLESDDCDATGPRPIWTSTCVLDDQCRSEAWLAVSVWDHTQKPAECDWKRHMAEERADPVEAPVGSNTQPATESQEPAPAAQQEPAS